MNSTPFWLCTVPLVATGQKLKKRLAKRRLTSRRLIRTTPLEDVPAGKRLVVHDKREYIGSMVDKSDEMILYRMWRAAEDGQTGIEARRERTESH